MSNVTTAQLDEYRRAGVVDADQERYGLLDRGHEADLLPYCRKNGVAFLAYSPLANGLLTGRIGPERTFGPGDLRNGNPRFSAENRRLVAEMLAELRPLAEARGLNVSQLVIAWTAHQPGCSHVLVGARTPEQARENAAAGSVTLTDDELRRMNATIEAYKGRVK